MASANVTQMYQNWDSVHKYWIQVAYTLTVAVLPGPENYIQTAYSNSLIPTNAVSVQTSIINAIISDVFTNSGVTLTSGQVSVPLLVGLP